MLFRSLVERVLLDKGTDTVIILAKAAGCSWATTKAILIMHSAGRGLSQLDVERASGSFERLSQDAARHAIKFYERRGKRPGAKATQEAEESAALPADLVSTGTRDAEGHQARQ